ncbi:hypothetical protein NL299_28200, partial [Klebsiella pneumoniae]|nr:hypothetical protein [Klebsiella pneumoniae]
TVIDGSRLHDTDWISQDLYQDQLKAAQIVLVSHTNSMSEVDQRVLSDLKDEYLTGIQTWIMAEQGNIQIEQIDIPHRGIQR